MNQHKLDYVGNKLDPEKNILQSRVCFIPCIYNCIYQKEGYCSLSIPGIVTNYEGPGCVHYVKKSS